MKHFKVLQIFLAVIFFSTASCTGMVQNGSFEGALWKVKLGLTFSPSAIESKSPAGYNPLHFAACGGQLDIVEYLVEKGADVDSRADDGCIPLQLAVIKGHKDVVEFFIANGADVNTKIKVHGPKQHCYTESPLSESCRDQLEMYGALTVYSANETLLHSAALRGHIDIAKILVENGADVNATRYDDATPLHNAVLGKNLKIVKLLVNNGAWVNMRTDIGVSPLGYSYPMSKEEVYENKADSKITKFLKKHKAVK
jgi:ankyrin repeat protein